MEPLGQYPLERRPIPLPPQSPTSERCLFGATGYSYELPKQPGGVRGQQLAALPFLFDQGDSSLAEVVKTAEMPTLKQSPAATTRVKHPPRRKPGRKDRHSKIPTLKGMRDRRMRLSLDIARKFFKLQDLLGYDKASKTVKWLMDNARPAIKQLAGSASRSILLAPSSEYEAFSNSDDGDLSNTKKARLTGGDGCMTQKQKGIVGSLRGVASITIAKESREKARARARERTREKINMKRRLQETAKEESKSNTNCSSLSHELKSSPELIVQAAELKVQAAELTSCSHEEHNQCGPISDDMIQSSLPSILDSEENSLLNPRIDSTLYNNIILNHHNETVGCWLDQLVELSDADDVILNSALNPLQNMQSPLQFSDVQFFLWPW